MIEPIYIAVRLKRVLQHWYGIFKRVGLPRGTIKDYSMMGV